MAASANGYLNNIIEQDHRFIQKRIVAGQWFRSVQGAVNAIQRYEAMNMIRKGQVRRLPTAISQVRSDLWIVSSGWLPDAH